MRYEDEGLAEAGATEKMCADCYHDLYEYTCEG
jgi:hypothetical protein